MNNNKAAEPISPPSFLDGLSPENLLKSREADRLVTLYGEETAIELLVRRYQRQQLIALLESNLVPDDEQSAFQTAVNQGRPIRLNEDGLLLRKVEGGWRCEAGLVATGDYPTPAEALQAYVDL